MREGVGTTTWGDGGTTQSCRDPFQITYSLEAVNILCTHLQFVPTMRTSGTEKLGRLSPYLLWFPTSGGIIHHSVLFHFSWGVSPVNHKAPGGDFRSHQLCRWPNGGKGWGWRKETHQINATSQAIPRSLRNATSPTTVPFRVSSVGKWVPWLSLAFIQSSI